ncbi:MAG: YpdA family putative bacillithiol disulfide reductase, partial [Marinirhabdus sp.]
IVLEKGALTNSLYNYPLGMRFFSTSEKLEIGNIPFISVQPKPDRSEALEYYRRVAASNGLNINLFEKVLSVKKEKGHFNIKTSKTQYTAQHVIVATGFYDIPKYLNVPGEGLPKVSHYYKEAHPYSLQKVVVVGASNSAVDAALELYRKGAVVTMVVRGKSIGPRVKYWVRPDIENRIKEGDINAFFNAGVTKITPTHVHITTPKGAKALPNDYVVALTGYRPNFEFLEKMGIALSKTEERVPQYNKKTMESNVSGLYLAGVICGGTQTHKWFIENSRAHAQLIVRALLQKA